MSVVDWASERESRQHADEKWRPWLHVAVVVLVALGVVLSAVPAEAASGARAVTRRCTGIGCSGEDPQRTGCSRDARNWVPARVIRRASGTTVGKVELRYSANCGTTWSRVTSYVGRRKMVAQLQIFGRGTVKRSLFVGNTYRVEWSRMQVVEPGVRYRARAQIYLLRSHRSWAGVTRFRSPRNSVNWHGCPQADLCFYEHNNYGGRHRTYVPEDYADLEDVRLSDRNFENVASSVCNHTRNTVRVANDRTLRTDETYDVAPGCQDLPGDWNDKVDYFINQNF